MEIYIKNGRLEQFKKYKSKCGGSKLVLFLNREKDRSWIVNTTACIASKIIDLPELAATGSIIGIIYFVAWWIGVVLTGGGILAVLAYIGSIFGGIPGVPPVIAGIIYLAIMFKILYEIFSFIFS